MKISEYLNAEIIKRYKLVYLDLEYHSNNKIDLRYLLNKLNVGFHNKLILDNVMFLPLLPERKEGYNEFLLNKLERIIPAHILYDTCNLSGNYSDTLPFTELCSIVDIDFKKLKKSFNIIYSKPNYKLNFIGLGGMNYNILTFWDLLIRELRLCHLYNKQLQVEYYEDDKLEWHNLYRFYCKPSALSNNIDLYFDAVNKVYLAPNISCHTIKHIKRFDIYDIRETGSIFIGGVDMQTRNLLNKVGIDNIPFISTVHNGNNAYIVTKQTYEGVEVETYGSITVPFLLLNILKLTEHLVNYIAELFDKNESNFAKLMAVDTIQFKFNSKDYLIKKAKKHKFVMLNKYNRVEVIKFKNGKYDMLLLDNANN